MLVTHSKCRFARFFKASTKQYTGASAQKWCSTKLKVTPDEKRSATNRKHADQGTNM